MYGRPEGSVSSCLQAFDNSIIPFRSIDLRAEWFFWSIPASFSTIHWSAKIFEGLEGYRWGLQLHLAMLKKRDSRAPHTGVTISNSFLPQSVDFMHGHRKWNARVRMNGVPLFNRHIPRAVGLILQTWETHLGIKFAGVTVWYPRCKPNLRARSESLAN